ncbi:MAG: sugar porter family MFS transporter [Polyangiaceae bacterium]|nr:sugar porter family MFS transporter [Polyangiaceae bacterium]
MPEQRSTNFGFVILITLVATIGGFLFGYDSGVINGTVKGLQQAFHSDSVATGFNVASLLLGCAAGAFFAGWLADKFGRRTILIVASICFAVSALGSGFAGSSLEFILYRLLGGLGVGAASVLAPAYISEVAPAKYRGTLSSIQQIAIITGLFASALSNYLLAHVAGESTSILAWGFPAWRWMFWVMVVPSVLFFVSLLTIPESPRYLVASRKKDKALKVLTRLMGAEAQTKLEEIDASLVADHHRPKLTDILDNRRLFRPIVWVGIGLASFQQLVGINVVFYYSAVVWGAAGFAEDRALLTTVITNAASIVACIIATTLIDRVGRKPLLLIGSIGMAVTLGILAVVFGTASGSANGALELSGTSGPIALVSMILYAMLFNVSWGPVMWVMLGEMFPNQIRGSGLAVSGLSQWMSNFAITMTFPLLLTNIGLGGSYGIYTAFAIISIFFVVKLIHETKGKELEQMQG